MPHRSPAHTTVQSASLPAVESGSDYETVPLAQAKQIFKKANEIVLAGFDLLCEASNGNAGYAESEAESLPAYRSYQRYHGLVEELLAKEHDDLSEKELRLLVPKLSQSASYLYEQMHDRAGKIASRPTKDSATSSAVVSTAKSDSDAHILAVWRATLRAQVHKLRCRINALPEVSRSQVLSEKLQPFDVLDTYSNIPQTTREQEALRRDLLKLDSLYEELEKESEHYIDSSVSPKPATSEQQVKPPRKPLSVTLHQNQTKESESVNKTKSKESISSMRVVRPQPIKIRSGRNMLQMRTQPRELPTNRPPIVQEHEIKRQRHSRSDMTRGRYVQVGSVGSGRRSSNSKAMLQKLTSGPLVDVRSVSAHAIEPRPRTDLSRRPVQPKQPRSLGVYEVEYGDTFWDIVLGTSNAESLPIRQLVSTQVYEALCAQVFVRLERDEYVRAMLGVPCSLEAMMDILESSISIEVSLDLLNDLFMIEAVDNDVLHLDPQRYEALRQQFIQSNQS